MRVALWGLGVVLAVGCGDDGDTPAGSGQAGFSNATGGQGGNGGASGSGGAQGGKAGEGGQANACTESSAKTGNDPENCGKCGYGCLGGACEAGRCKPAVVRESFPKNGQLQVDDTTLFYVHPASNAVMAGPKVKANADKILVDDKLSKESFASVGDALFWKESPATVRQLAKAEGATLATAIKIDHFGPDVAVGTSGIYFTTQYALWVAQPGEKPFKIKDAPGQKTFFAPRLAPDYVFLRMGNVGTEKATQLVRLQRSTGGLTSLAAFDDDAFSHATGPTHVAVARRKPGNDTALCAGEPSAELWSFPLDGVAQDRVVLAAGLANPKSLALDSKHLYWRNTCDGAVWRVPLAGGEPEQLFAGQPGAGEGGLALDDESVYFSFQTKLYRLAKGLDGGEVGDGDGGAAGVGGAGGDGGAGGGTSASPCCKVSGSPGCSADPAVEQCVCAQDAFCCNFEWDSACVEQIEGFGCGSCGGGTGGKGGAGGSPGTGDCCQSNPTPGCNDPAIQACVCAKDSFCCSSSWDSICASEVLSLGCGLCPGACLKDSDCSDPGKNLCDTSTNKCVGPCASNLDCSSFNKPTCDVSSGKCVGCLSNADCSSSISPVCDPATNLCVGCLISDDCTSPSKPVCTPSLSCGCTGDSDCPSDALPFCLFGSCVECTSDSDCPSEDAAFCVNNTCKDDPKGNCCEATSGVKGCKDPVIQDCVCEVDPFCCNTAWDSICAGEVEMLGCGTCEGTGGAGGEGGASGSAGAAGDGGSAGAAGSSVDPCSHDVCEKGAPLSSSCNACTAKVCGIDKFCCQVSWNSTCVKRTEQFPECVCGGEAGHSGEAGAGGNAGAGGGAGEGGAAGASGEAGASGQGG
jgi:hypothetical protein